MSTAAATVWGWSLAICFKRANRLHPAVRLRISGPCGCTRKQLGVPHRCDRLGRQSDNGRRCPGRSSLRFGAERSRNDARQRLFADPDSR